MSFKQNAPIDRLPTGSLMFVGAKDAYRYSIDPFLLCGYVDVRCGDTVVDLGTATGIIPVILAETTAAKRLVGIEIQQHLAADAVKNVQLNHLESKIEIVTDDIRNTDLCNHSHVGSVDVVVTNPPYFNVGVGKYPKNTERAFCRHELAGGIDDFVKAACHLLRDGGRFYISFLAERLVELLSVMKSNGISPERIRPVQSFHYSNAHIVLIEGCKKTSSGVVVQPPLVIYREENVYSYEVLSLLGLAVC